MKSRGKSPIFQAVIFIPPFLTARPNSAPIKTTTEDWYRDNIANNASYNNLVSTDAIYCNDRAGDSYASSGTMYYAAFNRLWHDAGSSYPKQPTYKVERIQQE